MGAKIIFLTFFLGLTACSGQIAISEARYESSSFQYEKSELPDREFLVVSFFSEENLFDIAADDKSNLWVQVKKCKDGLEVMVWPEVYFLSGDGPFRYFVLVPKENLIDDKLYCLMVGVGNMLFWENKKSNILEIQK